MNGSFYLNDELRNAEIDIKCNNAKKNISPDKGLEPLTSGLKVPRSTDWANRALTNCR